MKRVPSLILAAAERAVAKAEARTTGRERATGGRSVGGKKNHCHVDPASVFQSELTGLADGKGDFAWACCPFHDDHHPSFCVNLESGWYECRASHCGETGRNIVSFVSALHGFNFAEAREYLEAHYG